MIALSLVILLLAFLFSMLGLGGSMLYVPAFTWFGLEMKSVAIPTGLLLNGVTALSAASYYLRAKMVDVRGTAPMVVTSLIAVPAGAVLPRFVPTDALMLLFSLGMLVAGSIMLLKSSARQPVALLPFGNPLGRPDCPGGGKREEVEMEKVDVLVIGGGAAARTAVDLRR